MRQDAHRCIEQQLLSPIGGGLAGHVDLGDVGMLGRALDRWSAKQSSTRNPFKRTGQADGPRGISEEEYHRQRQEKNDRSTLKKWGVKVKNGDLAAARAKAKAEREQAAREKAAADYGRRVAALPEHIRAQYDLTLGQHRAWQMLKTAEWVATLNEEEQQHILSKRRTAKAGGFGK
jgi:hypothetical protein